MRLLMGIRGVKEGNPAALAIIKPYLHAHERTITALQRTPIFLPKIQSLISHPYLKDHLPYQPFQSD